jgi:hypothetical protein
VTQTRILATKTIRKTVRTITRTRTTIKTVTLVKPVSFTLYSGPFQIRDHLLTQKPSDRTQQQATQILRGQLYLDINNNNKFDETVDTPYASVLVQLRRRLQLQQSSVSVAENTTDNRGNFVMTINTTDLQNSPSGNTNGTQLFLAAADAPNTPLRDVKTTSDGVIEPGQDFSLPVDPASLPTSTVSVTRLNDPGSRRLTDLSPFSSEGKRCHNKRCCPDQHSNNANHDNDIHSASSENRDPGWIAPSHDQKRCQ